MNHTSLGITRFVDTCDSWNGGVPYRAYIFCHRDAAVGKGDRGK